MVKPYPYNKSAYYAVKYGYPTAGAGVVKGAATKIQRAFRKRRQTMWLKKYVPTAYKMKPAAAPTKYGKRLISAFAPKQRSMAYQRDEAVFSDNLKLGCLTQNIVPFPRADSYADRLNTKQTANLFVKGIRFVRTFEFNSPPTDGEDPVKNCPPIIMHWAVIQMKQPNAFVDDWTDIIKNKFFRTFDQSFDRVENFVDNDETSLWSSDKNWNRMNPDGNFAILTHRKKMLKQRLGETALDYKVQPYLWHIDMYMKLNKTFNYTNTDQAYPDNPLFEVAWYQTVTPTNYPFGFSNYTYVSSIRQPTVYYR